MVSLVVLRAMVRGMRKSIVLPMCLLAAACGGDGSDPGPGPVTQGEARALDDAARLLDERGVATVAAPDGPAAQASGNKGEAGAGR